MLHVLLSRAVSQKSRQSFHLSRAVGVWSRLIGLAASRHTRLSQLDQREQSRTPSLPGRMMYLSIMGKSGRSKILAWGHDTLATPCGGSLVFWVRTWCIGRLVAVIISGLKITLCRVIPQQCWWRPRIVGGSLQVATKLRSGGNSHLAVNLSRQAQIFAEGVTRVSHKKQSSFMWPTHLNLAVTTYKEAKYQKDFYLK